MSWWQRFDIWLENFLVNFIPDPETDPKSLPMNLPDEPITPPINFIPTARPFSPAIPYNPDALVPWTTPENCRHNVRAIADLEGLTIDEKDDYSRTIHCESNYNPKCVHPNIVNGKVTSTDYGLLQINDYWHIGTGKDFPSSDYVLNNPEACARWGARQWKAGNSKMWVCKLRGMSDHYSA